MKTVYSELLDSRVCVVHLSVCVCNKIFHSSMEYVGSIRILYLSEDLSEMLYKLSIVNMMQ